MNMIIYGAQGYALGAYKAISILYPDRRVLFFMVTEIGRNSPSLGGLDVKEIGFVSEQFSQEEKKNIKVLIATPENVQDDIEKTLDEFGFTNRTRLTSQLWDELMTNMNSQTGDYPPLEDAMDKTYETSADSGSSVAIYMAKSHKDKPLNNPFNLPDYMIPIQVGAVNAGFIISDIRDDTGDNISFKNGNYCELTGLYWVWRNILQEAPGQTELFRDCIYDINNLKYIGLAQYRRILMLTDEALSRVAENDIDVVLPYPLYYEPDISEHHKRYLKEKDWTSVLTALKELQPEYADEFPKVLAGECMYNYNVILAKKEILCDYCEWLFPILEYTEEMSDPKGCERSDRYIGYIGESLETLYFMKNKNRFKIAHTSCRLLV